VQSSAFRPQMWSQSAISSDMVALMVGYVGYPLWKPAIFFMPKEARRVASTANDHTIQIVLSPPSFRSLPS
jgi:hypothetical protein